MKPRIIGLAMFRVTAREWWAARGFLWTTVPLGDRFLPAANDFDGAPEVA